MAKLPKILALVSLLMLLALLGCNPNPQPTGLTPVPSLAPAATMTLLPQVQGGGGALPGTAGPSTGTTGGGTPQAGGGGGTTGATSQPDGAVGAAYYLQRCSPCHGNQGEGVDAPPLRNNPAVAAGGSAIFTIIANGVPGSKMPAWLVSNGGLFSDTQISDIVAYLTTLQNVPAIPTATAAPEEATETPAPANAPTPEPAQPSTNSQPGPAAGMTGNANTGQQSFGQYCATCHGPQGVMGIPNPGSEDESIPPINPIDPTIANKDPKIFAKQMDPFIEHGSIPDGPAPMIAMPAFGDQKLLSAQQIADIMVYVMKLNGVGQ